MSEFFDKDYFQSGLETGKSNFQNYRWLPELTMSLAMTLIDKLNIKKDYHILDFGCALGFLVKAFRLLHREAWGVDISEYAIRNADPVIKRYCHHASKLQGLPSQFDVCIAKDVFEHMILTDLQNLLTNFFFYHTTTLFVVVPLGRRGKYVAPANDLDKSHIICEDLKWWRDLFEQSGWDIKEESYKIEGIKDAYYEKYPKSHGFFILGS